MEGICDLMNWHIACGQHKLGPFNANDSDVSADGYAHFLFELP